MDIYRINDIGELINGNPYVGRGIVMGKSADGKKAILLVTDYYGRDMRIPVTVKGVKDAKNVTARVLSFEKDLEPIPVNVKDGRFTLAKPDAYSAAFIVTFDL